MKGSERVYDKAFILAGYADSPEIVHWHGLWIPSGVDGAMEEGSPMIAPQGRQRYSFAPLPSGSGWYHIHTFAGHDLKKATYTGQFGFFYIEPKEDPGVYDQEIFMALHDRNPHMSGGGDVKKLSRSIRARTSHRPSATFMPGRGVPGKDPRKRLRDLGDVRLLTSSSASEASPFGKSIRRERQTFGDGRKHEPAISPESAGIGRSARM
jgi:hypothetical protein